MDAAVSRPRSLFGPLFERDYLRICSRPSSFRSRTIAAALLVAAAGIVFAAGSDDQPDVLGRNLHRTFAVVGALVAGWMSLAEASTAIPAERSGGTLPLLLATPIPAHRLATGFLGSRIAYAGTVIVGLLPVEGLAMILGGVSGKDVLLATGAIATAGVWAGGCGLLASAGAQDSRRGLGRGVVLAIGWAGVLPLLLAFVGFVLSEAPALRAWREHGERVSMIGLGILSSTPAGSVLALFWGSYEQIDLPRWAAFAIPAAFAVVSCLLGVIVAARRLRRESDAAAALDGDRAAKAAIVSLRRRRGPGARPLAWKESRPPRSAWVRWGARAMLLGWTALLAWLWFDPDVREHLAPGQEGRPEFGFYDGLVSVPLWAMLLAATASSGTLVAEERERGSLDILRATPLSSAEWVLARPASSVRRLMPMVAITAAFAVVGVFLGLVGIGWLAAWIAGFAMAGPALVLGAFTFGSRAATVRSATRTVGMIFVTLAIGWPVFAGVMACLTRSELTLALSVVNPLVSVCGPVIVLGATADGWPSGEEGLLLAVTAAGTLAWAIVAAILWSRREKILDRAFQGADA